MTRKDYVLIAEVINKHIETDSAKYRLARAMGERLVEDNSRFDYHRFLKACGVKA